LKVFQVMPSFSTTGMRFRARACSSAVKYHLLGEMGRPGQ
jgi:hypothetical protein